MTAYYNEFDPFAADWLRELIRAGAIAPGIVDSRSITEVTPNDLQGFTQCHFFAGIGGWSIALRLAGWPDDRPVWTGSAPCQPFSTAGKQKGTADERHLFPVWMRLIKECHPATIFGEQVEAAIRHGWLDLVQDELEAEDYACGAICLPACSVGAPHIRQRLWFVAERLADSGQPGLEGHDRDGDGSGEPGRNDAQPAGSVGAGCRSGGLAEPNIDGCEQGCEASEADGYRDTANAESRSDRSGSAHALNGFWRDSDWLYCRDGKWRPAQPGTFPLASRVPSRVGRLRGYGNSIVPQAAAEVIRAYMESK